MSQVKGSPKTGGRKPNTPNAVPAMLRDMIIGVLVAKTPEEAREINPWLADLKEQFVPVYAGLLSRVIPKEMATEVSHKDNVFHLNMLGVGNKRHIVNTLPALAKIGVDDKVVEGEVSGVD